MNEFKQAWETPSVPKPIVIIGAGGIVNDAHLPAYRQAGFEVVGLFDINQERANELTRKWNIPKVFQSLEDATQMQNECVYDLALPPFAITETLDKLPDSATVLIQKPMGENWAQACEIRKVCQTKKLTSAINFQLRFSSQMLAMKDMIEQGLLGDLIDIEVHLNIHTPWHLFPFLKSLKRVEIAVHSIHYLDLIRSIVGSPHSVFAKTVDDPRVPELTQTRTTAILNYDQNLRCVMSINHNHQFGKKFQNAIIRIEGTKGAAIAKLGVLLDYPHGEPDELWIATKNQDWEQIPLKGAWFIDAFIGTMSNLQRFSIGEDSSLLTSTEDGIKTMALVEACFKASQDEGTLLPSIV